MELTLPKIDILHAWKFTSQTNIRAMDCMHIEKNHLSATNVVKMIKIDLQVEIPDLEDPINLRLTTEFIKTLKKTGKFCENVEFEILDNIASCELNQERFVFEIETLHTFPDLDKVIKDKGDLKKRSWIMIHPRSLSTFGSEIILTFYKNLVEIKGTLPYSNWVGYIRLDTSL